MGRGLKFQDVKAFDKHLSQGVSFQLSRVFLVVSPCPYERRRIVDKVVAAIRVKEGEVHFQGVDAKSSIEGVIGELNTMSLFKSKQVLYLDGVDKVKGESLDLLCDYAAKPSAFSYLVLGASAFKGVSELYSKGKRELVVCDLSQEKPWERKARLKGMLVEDLLKEGKQLSPEAWECLLENRELSLQALQSQLDKLLAYAGERSHLNLQDVQALCPSQKSLGLWELTEALAWKEAFPKCDETTSSLLLPLLFQLRTQMQWGLSVALLLEGGVQPQDIRHQFPEIRPAVLDKIFHGAEDTEAVFSSGFCIFFSMLS